MMFQKFPDTVGTIAIAACLLSTASCSRSNELTLNEDTPSLEDSADLKQEYYYGTSRIYLPAKNGVPEDEISYVYLTRSLDKKNATVQSLNTVIFDLEKPCNPEITSAAIKISDIDEADQKAKLTFTELITYGGAMANLQTRPESKSFHGELLGEAWAWKEVHSLVMGKAEGEIHRFLFDEIKDGEQMKTELTYGLCLNKECVDSKTGYTVEFIMKNDLKTIAAEEYKLKAEWITEYNEKNKEECKKPH